MPPGIKVHGGAILQVVTEWPHDDNPVALSCSN